MVVVDFLYTPTAFFSLQPADNKLLIVFNLYFKLHMLGMFDIPFAVHTPHMGFSFAECGAQRIELFADLIFNPDVGHIVQAIGIQAIGFFVKGQKVLPAVLGAYVELERN